MFRLALVNMPFAAAHLPSIALTQLRAVVASRFPDRVQTGLFYLNHDFYRYFGDRIYRQIGGSVQATVSGLGDWMFRPAAFPGLEDSAFLTSLNGKMWRLWTKLEAFPRGFGHCELALEARIFEASHTYRLKGRGQYLTVIEENGRRFYKAYLADRLDGPWTPLADTPELPFAGWTNIRPAPGVEPWTDNVSHGELLRDGHDQTLTVDPGNLRFLFQGMWDKDKEGQAYGRFQWRIGLLTPAPAGKPDEGS